MTFKLRKKNRGEFFEDTNMINNLLNKKNEHKVKKKAVKIEVLGGEDFKTDEQEETKEEKPIIKKEPHEIYEYGFNRKVTKFWENLEVIFILEILIF